MTIPRYVRRTVLLLIDGAAVFCAFGLAYALGVAFEDIDTGRRAAYLQQYFGLVGFLVAIRIALFAMVGLYRGIARYAGFHEMLGILFATALGTLALIAFNLLSPHLPPPSFLPQFPDPHRAYAMHVPWRVVVIEAILTLVAIGGLRFARRLLVVTGLLGARGGRNLLIIGVGASAERVCRELAYDPDAQYRPVALIDPDRTHIGGRLHGIPIVGGLESLPDAIARYQVEEILIALAEAPPALLRRIVAECEKTRVAFKQLPSLADLMAGKVTVSELRPVEIEDLLGRPQVLLALPDEHNYLRGETVLVTGAGGSIGSELCRQIHRYGPAQLILLGRGENSIYEIAAELGYRFDSHAIELIIADVRDEPRMTRVFQQWRPTVIYHAAAHKHVPLMELHPEEAVTNNIFGTEVVARLADRFGSKLFIQISTDKAVRPTNVMGATKRVAEMVVRDIARRSATRFLTVRFGNVLGSRGSVIPLFKKQIAAGGPVTVTHPEATRYCMTIPEAVSLVIQTGALGDRGSLFVLDMGQPVKVLDLARNLITLSGLEPDVDIPIQIVGLRPGEKLHEELLTSDEGLQRTEVGKVFVTQPDPVDSAFLREQLETLRRAAAAGDSAAIVAALRRLIPDYHPAFHRQEERRETA
ncbi:MAG: polysaccharide biosynthesis protein [Candidatus Sumerlaeia bacterium]|nr:polysaccharide biosynthesis protein [Candidatus Sumerlaeia bacterium]